MTVPTSLLEEVRNYLDITWADTTGDEKLSGTIERGMQFLNNKAGAELDYIEETVQKELLFEYCRHSRNGILNEFIINYAPFLQDLRVGNGGTYGQNADV